MKAYSPEWEKIANNMARSYCPNIYPCGKCESPVIEGYCCITCGDTNPRERRPTKRAVDEGESAPLQAESTPEHLPIEEADTTPALRN